MTLILLIVFAIAVAAIAYWSIVLKDQYTKEHPNDSTPEPCEDPVMTPEPEVPICIDDQLYPDETSMVDVPADDPLAGFGPVEVAPPKAKKPRVKRVKKDPVA